MFNFFIFIFLIINKKIIFKKLLNSINICKAQIFSIYKVVKVVLNSKYKNFIFTTFYIIFIYFKKINNYLKFSIVSFIPSLNKNYFFKKLFIIGF